MKLCNHKLWQINSGGFVFRWWNLNKWHKQAGKLWFSRQIHIHNAATSYYSVKVISTHFSMAALISEFPVLCIKRQRRTLPTRASSDGSRQTRSATGRASLGLSSASLGTGAIHQRSVTCQGVNGFCHEWITTANVAARRRALRN